MHKIKLSFVSSPEEDLLIFKNAHKYINFDTGQDNYAIFLGYLRNEIISRTKDKTKKETESIVASILQREYKHHAKLIRHNLNILRKEWNRINVEFIAAVEKTFDSNPFPRGKYRAIMSLWGRYPCILKQKKFYVPCHTQLMLLVVIHELLHFAFYSYFNKHFKRRLNKTKQGELTEILNVILMNNLPYLSWAKLPSDPYPSNKKRYEQLLKIYPQCNTMGEFIEKSISALTN